MVVILCSYQITLVCALWFLRWKSVLTEDISPQPSSNWGTYLTLRQERDRIFETEINKEFSGEELCASLLQVRQALTAVLANTNFTEEQQAAIFDSIVPVAFYTEESGFGKELVRMSSHSIRRAGSLTRDISHRK